MKKTMKTGFLRELKQSRGRFISIMLLMFLSTFTLVGLKLVGPDIRAMANGYLDQYQLADLSVMSTYGLNQADVEILDTQIDNAEVEYGYFTDVTIGDTSMALRLFSEPDNISEVELVSGKLPTSSGQIAVNAQLKDQYPIGSTIDVTEKGKTVNHLLTTDKFEVVGYVNSLEILQTIDLGSTNVGTGTLNGYGIIDQTAFDSDVYMIARIYFDDLRGEDAFLNDYLQAVSIKKSEVEATLNDQPQARLETVKADANQKIEDNLQELKAGEQALDDGAQELTDAELELANAKTELDNGYQKILDGQVEVNNGNAELAAAQIEINDGYAELESNQTKLDAAQVEINDGYAELASNQAKLDASKTELDTNQATITENQQQLIDGKTQYQSAIESLQANIDSINVALSDPALSAAEVAKYQQQLMILEQTLTTTSNQYNQFISETYNPGIEQLNAAQTQIDSGYAEISSGQQQIDDARSQLQAAQVETDNGQTEINSGYAKLDTASEQLTANQQKLTLAQTKLDAAMEAYQSGLAEYQVGLAEYQSGLEKYNQEEPQARQDIADGYEQIEDAQAEIDDLKLPVYSVNTRSETSTSGGYQLLTSLATSVDKVANVFPILLYAVAALVTFTTMTRYVEDERINTGTLLSLGYSEREIIKKYVIYGALSSSLGAIIGIGLGAWFIPTLLYSAFRDQFTTPDLVYTFNFGVAFMALAVSMLCAVIPAFMVASAEFKSSPASLLLPKPPSAGSKILLERITPVWNRLSFSHKVTARNIFRYKKRMFMTIFGVSGSVSLLFTGLGMQGSIGNVSPLQFGQIVDYDLMAVVDSGTDENEASIINDYFEQDIIRDYKQVYIENVSLEAGPNNERQTITLNVADNFDNYVTFRDRKTHSPIELEDGSVIISERLAQINDLEVGDTLTVMDSENLPVELQVGAITEMYMGHFMYATPATYQQAFGTTPSLDSYLVKLNDSSLENVTTVATDVIKLDGVQTVMQNQSLINQVDSMAASLNSVMKLIIVLAALLAVVILYNITNINVNERMRELSTTKVLGYYDQEVTMYIYRETMILSVIGIIVGYGFGRLIHLFMMSAVSPLNMMFDQRVVPSAFIAPAILIIIVSVSLGIIVHNRLKKVDMLEALKSVE